MMGPLRNSVLLSTVILCALADDAEFACKKKVTGSGVLSVFLEGTYDLCEFVVTSESKDGWYEVVDNRTVGNVENGDAQNYTFYFNVAANIAKPTPDPECDNYNETFRRIHGLEQGYCSQITSSGLPNATCPIEKITPITSRTAAYQAKKGRTDTDKCWRLHDGVTEPIWSFIDESDPALGLQLTYTNGDWCAAYGKNREFRMKFICANEVSVSPAFIETVYEPTNEGCTYEFVKETTKGCPTECVVDNDKLCSGHGVCDYDWAVAKPRCFCYNGWYGSACEDDKDVNREIVYQDSDNSYVGALVVVILLLLVILFILGYLFLRYTKVKNQPFDFKFLQKQKGSQRRAGQDEYETD